jgi:hypothetical protein
MTYSLERAVIFAQTRPMVNTVHIMPNPTVA